MPVDFERMTTFELAFNLATGKYSDSEKLDVLNVIRSRDPGKSQQQKETSPIPQNEPDIPIKESLKPPSKDSKAEKIYNLARKGKSVQETFNTLTKSGTKVYHPEIYRVYKKYGFPSR